VAGGTALGERGAAPERERVPLSEGVFVAGKGAKEFVAFLRGINTRLEERRAELEYF
jgi:hypothetical protein